VMPDGVMPDGVMPDGVMPEGVMEVRVISWVNSRTDRPRAFLLRHG